MAYKCRIAEIDDRSEFHICAKNFRVDQDPVQPFEDESMATACAHPAAETYNNKEARGSNKNASNNIGQGILVLRASSPSKNNDRIMTE